MSWRTRSGTCSVTGQRRRRSDSWLPRLHPPRPARRGGRKRGRRRNFLEVAALIVDNGSGMSMAGFAVLVLLTLYSLRLSAGLSCQASWTVWTRTTVLIVRSLSIPAVAHAGLALLVFLVLCSFSLSSGPRCSASWPVSTRGTVMHLAGFGDTSAVPQQNVPVTPKTLSGHTKTLSGHTKQSPVSPNIFFESYFYTFTSLPFKHSLVFFLLLQISGHTPAISGHNNSSNSNNKSSNTTTTNNNNYTTTEGYKEQ